MIGILLVNIHTFLVCFIHVLRESLVLMSDTEGPLQKLRPGLRTDDLLLSSVPWNKYIVFLVV